MDGVASADAFQFEGFRLDSDGLFRVDQAGTAEPVILGSRALDLLLLLVSHQRELVSKDQIMASVWRGIAVEEANLSVQISALRRILDQNRNQPSCIQTVIGRGYRFVAPVIRVETNRQPMPPAFCGTVSGDPIDENIARPVRAYTQSPEAVSASPAARVFRAMLRPDRAKLAVLAAAVSVALVLAGFAWWIWPAPRSPLADTPIAAASAPQPIAPRLSIVVLPFANLSNDPDQQYFADGITEDLTTDLSRLPNMLVISRNTAFTYKSKPVKAKEIGRELGVRYLLEGSVQHSENQLRVTVQLIDAETGAHLWAERFDRDAGNLFALQNEITSRIAMALNLELVAAEAARPSEKPDVLDYILRGRAALSKPPTRESYAEGIGFYERALALDPGSIDAQSWLANALAARVLDGKSDSPTEDIERAEALLATALAAAPRNPFLHHVKGQVLRARAVGPFGLDAEAITSRYADAIPEYEIYLAANPNAVGTLAHLGICRIMTGAADEAIPLLEKAIRLGPRDPYFFLWSVRIGFAHLLQGRISEAIDWLEKSRRANPSFPSTHQLLASAYGLKGETDRAAAELVEFLAADPRQPLFNHCPH